MKSVTYNSTLDKITGEFLSQKPKRLRVVRKKKLKIIQGSTQNSQSRLIPRRLTSQLFRKIILASTLATVIAQEGSENAGNAGNAENAENDIKDNIFNPKSSKDIFLPHQSKSTSTASPSFNQIFDNSSKQVCRDSLQGYKDLLLADPSKNLNLKSISPETLSGFLNEKGFKNQDWTALIYLASFKDLQVNFLNILMHSSQNIDLLKLITSQVDNKGNNILHVSCQFENIDHLIAIFNNINSAYFYHDQEAVNKIKKEMIMKFNHEEYTPLMQAVKSNNSEIVERILSQSKFFDKKTDYSFDVLMQANKSGNSPLLLAISNKNYQLLESLLVNFDIYNPQQKEQIKQVFRNSNNQIFDDLFSYVVNDDSNKISQIIKTLKKINYPKEELKDLLTKQVSDEYGDTAYTALAYKGNIESMLSILSAFDPSNKEDIKRLNEIFLAENKKGFSAMHFLIVQNSDENIEEIIKFFKQTGNENLKDLLIKQSGNSTGDTAFISLTFKQKTKLILSILSAFDPSNKEDIKRLNEIFLAENKKGFSAMHFLIVQNSDENIEEIIKFFKQTGNENLKDLLIKQNGNSAGDTAFISLTFKQKTKLILSILSAFDPNNEDDIKRLNEIFLAENKKGFSAMHYLIFRNSDENIEEIIKFFKQTGNENLKDLLIKQNGYSVGDNAFISLVFNQKTKSILSTISAFDPSNKEDIKRLNEIFLSQNKQGFSALFFMVSYLNNISAFRCIEKLITINSNEEIKKIFTQTFSDKRILPIFTSLLLAGNDNAIEEILKRDVKIEIDELPYSYFSPIPNIAIYYLEAFKKDVNNQIKAIKYYNPIIEGDKIEKKEINFMDIKLNDDMDKPLIVEIVNNDNSSKKIIITGTIINNSKNRIIGNNLNLQNTFKLAESDNLDQIVINLDIGYYNLLASSHAITIKLTRNNDSWDIVYHDPNSLLPTGSFRSVTSQQTNEKIIKAICEQNGIKINSLIEHDNIITNDSLGSCDSISSIVSASMIIGNDHSQKLAKKCQEYFRYHESDKSKILSVDGCIRHIGGDELNKKVKIILEEKLELIKSKMKDKPSTTIASERIEENKLDQPKSLSTIKL
jgi:hypothetical protein